LNVTTNRDPAATGLPQRVNQVNSNPYGDKDSLTNYLNAAAFSFPAAGTLGNHQARSIEGPPFQKVDLSMARVLRLAEQRTLEFRAEVFNVFNTVQLGRPEHDASSRRSSAGSLRRSATRGSGSSQ
jgi:hypothetical protein